MNGKEKCPLTGKPCDNHKGFHVTESVGGEVQNFSMCESCFKDFNKRNPKLTKLYLNKVIDEAKHFFETIFGKFFTVEKEPEPKEEETIDITHLFDDLEDIGVSPTEVTSDSIEEAIKEIENALCECKKCGLRKIDLKTTNRLGCGDCYDTFHAELAPLIKQYHKTNKHDGKAPKNHEENEMKEFFNAYELAKYQIFSLDEKLSLAILREEYEDAAILRDTIAALKAKLNDLRSETSEDQ